MLVRGESRYPDIREQRAWSGNHVFVLKDVARRVYRVLLPREGAADVNADSTTLRAFEQGQQLSWHTERHCKYATLENGVDVCA